MIRMTATALTLCALAAGAAAQHSHGAAGVPQPVAQALGTITMSERDIPVSLRPAEPLRAFMQVHAKGVQIYECARGKTDNWEWQFRSPEATLLDAKGTKVGDHGAGPFWSLEDGSRIVGQVQSSSPSPTGGAIPWLLLTVKSHVGSGALDAAEAVQRINTQGGVAPSEPCSSAAAGTTARVPYSADYLFWRNAPGATKG